MNISKRILASLVIGAGSLLSYGQGNGWFFECIDPENDTPYNGYLNLAIGNNLIGVTAGIAGTVTYGGQNGPCYGPTARTLNASGRLAFWVGGEGSIQSDFDDGLALTVGAPVDAVGDYTYVKILKDGETNAQSVLYGGTGLRLFYVGASKRYMITAWNDADVDVEMQAKVIGDAIRLRWRMRNLKAENQNLGLLFGCYPGMFAERPDSTGSTQANSYLATLTGIRKGLDVLTDDYLGFITLPSGRPVRNERRYDTTSPKFPDKFEVLFGQSEPYGIRFDNLPGSDTPDASSADLMLIGSHGNFLQPGLLWDNEMRLRVFTDVDNNPNPMEEADILLSETSIIQRFPTTVVTSGDAHDVVHYIRSPWGVSNYEDPYTFTLDGPRLLSTQEDSLNGLTPNPFTIRAYVDNQYATLDKEVDLHNVKFTIFLPPGLSLASGEPQQKTLNLIQANALGHVDWRVVSDGKTFGDLSYQVSCAPTPGPAKTLTGKIRVSATPRLNLPPGANMVTIPYTFTDTSLDDILQLQAGIDYIAYRWDPDQASYIPAISVERGQGYWIIPVSNLGHKALQGAKQPTDQATGGLLVSLHQGWNLIGNPYSYSVPLSELVVVAEDNPQDSMTWIDAVANDFVQASMIYWQRDDDMPGGGQYVYTQGFDDVLIPHRGYWVYVTTFKPIRLSWPPVFAPGLPNSGRAVDNAWTQNDRQWRLQLSARTVAGIDSQNYIGVVSDKNKLKALTLRKPPASPEQPVELYIEQQVNGQTTRMSQSLINRAARTEWNINVKVAAAGDVTLTWPNLPSVPRNMRFKVTDLVTGESKDLRSTSGFTFRMADKGIRKLKLSMEPGGSSKPVIGNVLVTRPSRGNVNDPVTISYALSADALVTVRVLSSQGKEVFTLTRGRSDSAGQNSVTWAMRDNANRTVSTGVYRVEILAETPNGERVRRLVPVNVTR